MQTTIVYILLYVRLLSLYDFTKIVAVVPSGGVGDECGITSPGMIPYNLCNSFVSHINRSRGS